MKCPIRMIAAATTQTPYEPRLIDCLQAECAWWDALIKMCMVRELIVPLRCIEISLHNMERNYIKGGKA